MDQCSRQGGCQQHGRRVKQQARTHSFPPARGVCPAPSNKLPYVSCLLAARAGAYVQIASKQLVGVYLTIWAKRGLLPFIRGVQVISSCVGQPLCPSCARLISSELAYVRLQPALQRPVVRWVWGEQRSLGPGSRQLKHRAWPACPFRPWGLCAACPSPTQAAAVATGFRGFLGNKGEVEEASAPQSSSGSHSQFCATHHGCT